MKTFRQIIHRTQDNSYVIKEGTYHVPNEGEYASLWQEVHEYALAYSDMVTEERPYVPSLDEVKAGVLFKAQQTFVAKRDAIRWVNGYGFDCAPEDITNFMAAYTPLLVVGAGTTQYKVWLTESTKGIVTLSLADMIAVYETVRASQLEAYAWYEGVKAQIEAAGTQEELNTIEV